MAILDGVKNAFIDKVLNNVLDGDKGSNILGALLTAVVAAKVDYVKAMAGFQFKSAGDAAESAKLVSAVALATFAWFVGKKKPV